MSLQTPAAHSMDTTWFGVDLDGYVAVFETNEAGGLPLHATMTAESGGFDVWPLWVVVATRALVDGVFVDEKAILQTYDTLGIVMLRADAGEADIPDALRDDGALARDWFVVREREPRVLATTRHQSHRFWRQLQTDPLVRRVLPEDEIREWAEAEDIPMFRFTSEDDDDPGLYRRNTAPTRPMTVDDLPPDLRAPMRAATLALRFAASDALHLADHFDEDECATWGDEPLRGAPRDDD